MALLQRFNNFLNYIFSYFNKNKRKKIADKSEFIEADDSKKEDMLYEKNESEENEDKIKVAKRTLKTRLYALEQEVTVFESSFPNEYKAFMDKIELLRKSYDLTLEKSKEALTYEINPELNSSKIGEVIKLERNVQEFIEKEVKFDIISKRLQRLIVKLNILYNVSISHSKDCEKERVISQLEHALKLAREITQDFKDSDYILNDSQLKERIVSLISYVDYEIFKASLRNSKEAPEQVLKKLTMLVEFNDFDYVSTFKSFIKDEISDLGELLHLISNDEYRKIFNKKITKLLTDCTYSDAENYLFNSAFWDDFLDFESNFLQMLKNSGVEQDKAKVRLIIRMNISVDKSDIFVLPITIAHLSLTSLFVTTHDERIILLIKLLQTLSNDVTYKEIYFLLQLFDLIGVVQSTNNDLFKHVEKYIKKYPYDRETILKKKNYVRNSSNKEYVVVFTLDGYEKTYVEVLEKLNIDFKVEDNVVFINSFYFNGLQNVLTNLQFNTENMMI